MSYFEQVANETGCGTRGHFDGWAKTDLIRLIEEREAVRVQERATCDELLGLLRESAHQRVLMAVELQRLMAGAVR